MPRERAWRHAEVAHLQPHKLLLLDLGATGELALLCGARRAKDLGACRVLEHLHHRLGRADRFGSIGRGKRERRFEQRLSRDAQLHHFIAVAIPAIIVTFDVVARRIARRNGTFQLLGVEFLEARAVRRVLDAGTSKGVDGPFAAFIRALVACGVANLPKLKTIMRRPTTWPIYPNPKPQVYDPLID